MRDGQNHQVADDPVSLFYIIFAEVEWEKRQECIVLENLCLTPGCKEVQPINNDRVKNLDNVVNNEEDGEKPGIQK